MKLLVIGSRTFNNFELLQNSLQGLNFSKIISGGARGADSFARLYAQKNSIAYSEIKPDYKKFGKVAPMVRNSDLVKKADFIIAFWNGKSKGTLDTILKAKKLRKPYKIVNF